MKKARNSVRASLASRQPLLFLYPQWARRSSSASEPVFSTPPILCHKDTFQDTPFVSASESFLPPPYAAVIENANSFEYNLDHGEKTTTPSTSRRPSNNGGTAGSLQDQRLERKVSRILWANKEASNSAYRALEARKDFEAKRRARTSETRIVNWREILADLQEHTPDYGPWLEQALSIEIPPSSIGQLFHSIDMSMWEIAKKYSCSTRLGKRDAENRCRTFIVSGPLTALAKVVADLIQSHPDVEISRASENKSEDDKDSLALDDSILNLNQSIHQPEVRLTRVKDTKRKPARRKLKKPTVWTPDTLIEYLRAIVDPAVTGHWKLFGLQAPADHRQTAPGLLMELFTDPQCRASITTTAFHEAFEYLIKANLMVDVRVLFVHMEMMKIPADTELFNVMLEGAAKNRDLHNFRLILHLMLNRGHLPNSGTWIAFIRAFSDAGVKAHVVAAMEAKGLASSKRITRILCAEFATAEISSSLENSQSHEEFVAFMDDKYGEDWLSVDAANHILNVMASRGLTSRCWEFLHFMASRFEPPNQVSVKTILGWCYHVSQRNLPGAIELLQNLPSTTNFIPDPRTYEMLFVLAWGRRWYNVARVVWRYACLSAATSYRMRERMFTHLKRARQGHISMTQSGRRVALLGPLILGSSYEGTHPVQLVKTHDQKDHLIQGDDAAVKISSATLIKDVALHGSSDESKLSDPADTAYTAWKPLCSDVSTISVHSRDEGVVQISPKTQIGDAGFRRGSDEAEVSTAADELYNWKPLVPNEQPNPESDEDVVKISPKAQIGDAGFRRVSDEAEVSTAADVVTNWKPLVPHEQPNPERDLKIRTVQELPLVPLELPTNLKEPLENRTVKELLELDYKAFHHWRPARPFADMLALALKKDTQWETRIEEDKKDPNFDASLKWMLNDAIAIPLQKNTNDWYHQAQPWRAMNWK